MTKTQKIRIKETPSIGKKKKKNLQKPTANIILMEKD